MGQYNTESIYMIRVTLPNSINQILNRELIGLGLSRSSGIIAFKRNTTPEFDKVKYTHVDYSDYTDAITNASIIIPVSECLGTGMYWTSGDYTLTKGQDHMGNSKMDVVWNSPGTIVHKEEIVSPTLVRVNIPHGAYSRQDGTYRLILSVRLEKNETFDNIVNKIKAKTD